jgi:hypothetical protein
VAKSEPLSFRHCLRDSQGRAVPYVNIWSGELPEETWRMTYDTGLKMLGIAMPVAKRGVGEPDFTRQAPDRQRECMIRRRCQICHVGTQCEWLVVSNSVGSRTIMYEGKKTLVLTEPWMCKPCADYAISTCPALIRRRRDDDLILCKPIRYRLGYSQGWVEGPLQERSQREMPAMWAEVHVTEAVDEKGRLFTLKLATA